MGPVSRQQAAGRQSPGKGDEGGGTAFCQAPRPLLSFPWAGGDSRKLPLSVLPSRGTWKQVEAYSLFSRKSEYVSGSVQVQLHTACFQSAVASVPEASIDLRNSVLSLRLKAGGLPGFEGRVYPLHKTGGLC